MTITKKWALVGLAVFAAASLTGLIGHSALAAKAQDLSLEQTATVEKITNYFRQVRNIRGEFTQISPKGKVSSGVFVISKPGKLRFEYAPPNPLLIVSDGTWLTIKNKKSDKADQYPLAATPLNLILGVDADFTERALVKSVDVDKNLATILLEDKEKSVAGHIILTYDIETSQLQQWVVVDGQGRRTTITLSNVEEGVQADPKLFTVKIPRRQPKADN